MVLTGHTRDDSQLTFLFGKRNCYNSVSDYTCSSRSNLSEKNNMWKDSRVPTSTWSAKNPRTGFIPCQCGVPGQWMNLTSLLMGLGAPQFPSGKRRERPVPGVEGAKSFNCNQTKNISSAFSNYFHSYQFNTEFQKIKWSFCLNAYDVCFWKCNLIWIQSNKSRICQKESWSKAEWKKERKTATLFPCLAHPFSDLIRRAHLPVFFGL